MPNQTIKKAVSFFDEFIAWSAIFVVVLIPLFFWPASVTSQYPLIWIYLIPKAVVLRVGTYVLAFLWLIRTVLKLVSGEYTLRPTLGHLLAVIFLFGFWVVSHFALNKNFAWYGSIFWLEGLYTYTNYILFFLLGSVFGSQKILLRLVKALIITTIFISSYAILEAYYPQIQAFTNVGFAGRSGATAGNAVILGAYLVIPLTLITTFLIWGGFNSKFWRLASLVSLTLAIPALAFTFSRGAWLAAGLAALLVLYYSWRYFRQIQVKAVSLILVLVMSSLIIYFGPRGKEVVPRAFSAFNPTEATAQTRLILWQQAFRLVKQYPLTGTGVDSYAYAVAKHFPSQKSVALDKPHNYFLELLVTLGLPVGVIYLFWLGSIVVKLGVASGQRVQLLIYNKAVLVSLVTYLTAIFFLFSTINNAPLFYFLLGIGTRWRE